ncbi:hypothetical protein GW17_00050055 [Ensete ventricosum]|nr:hypothetical protein GW17_00050055 [Ensete ventricosum]
MESSRNVWLLAVVLMYLAGLAAGSTFLLGGVPIKVAFKELACPYADQLDDETNDCASTMFSYINLYGKYPPGLFASECREGKEGLACPATPPTESEGGNPSAGFTTQTLALLFSRFCILETGKMSCFLDVAVVPLFLLVSVILWNGSDVSAYLKPGRCHGS